MKVTQIEYQRLGVNDLRLFEGNPRRGDVGKIADSLRARGQYKPITVNRGSETGRALEVLAGNHTLLAARSLGWSEIDCALIDVDDQTARAIVAADNRLSDLGGYDDAALAALLEDLDSLEATGYSDDDLAALLAASSRPEELTERDDAPAVPEETPLSVPGDVYELGPHRVLCGDSTDADSVLENLLFDGLADCVWTDPPYGVNYVGKTADSLTIENDSDDGLQELLSGAFGTLVLGCRPGAPVYVSTPQGPLIAEFMRTFVDAGIIWRQNLVWVKNIHALGHSDYHYKHEPILYGEVPDFSAEDVDLDAPYADGHTSVLYGFSPGGKGRLGRGGDRWFGDNNQFSTFVFPMAQSDDVHPTKKPVDLVLAMLRNSCPPGGVVLDLFGGSGSTLIAAHHRGAVARLVELDPRYVDVICRRWQEHTGVFPVRDGEEVSFL